MDHSRNCKCYKANVSEHLDSGGLYVGCMKSHRWRLLWSVLHVTTFILVCKINCFDWRTKPCTQYPHICFRS
jgi:hypothetical protein